MKEKEETYERDAPELIGAFKAEAKEDEKTVEEALKAFNDAIKNVDRDNEVQRILWAFKLNPFEKLNLRFTASESEIKKQYRKLSLLVHPDKCTHPKAPDAFELLGAAQKELLDEENRERLMRILEYARQAIREERRKATKHDSAIRVASSLHAEGRSGVEAGWEETDDFHDKWKMKSRDVLARAEFRRIKLGKRMKEEEARVEAEEKEEAQKRKKKRQETKEFLSTRDSRINSWRAYTKGGPKIAGTKAPKIKTWDAERSYVQRATTEQFMGKYKKKPPK